MRRPDHIVDYVAQHDTDARWYKIAYWWRESHDEHDRPTRHRAHGSASLLIWHRKQGHGIGFQFGINGSESDIGLDVHLGRLGSIWLRYAAPWTKRFRIEGDYDARHTSLFIRRHDMSWISWEIMERANHWSRSDPWWMHGNVNKHTFFGRQSSEKEVGREGECQIPMPEGVYPATWRKERFVQSYVGPVGKLRDRLFGPRIGDWHYWIDIEGGIPVEGKGENSWDCGMDGIFGTGGSTLEAAIGNLVAAALRDRNRHGGPHHLTRPMTVTEAENAGGPA